MSFVACVGSEGDCRPSKTQRLFADEQNYSVWCVLANILLSRVASVADVLPPLLYTVGHKT